MLKIGNKVLRFFGSLVMTAFVCHALSETSSSFRQPSAVCFEEGSTNTLIMTDTNNGRLKNVPGEFAEAVKCIQMDRNR